MIDKCHTCGVPFEVPPLQIKHRKRQCTPCGTASRRACRAVDPEREKQRYKKYRSTPTAKARASKRSSWLWANDPVERLKMQARDALHSEIRAGRMVKQPCEKCGNANTHGHHEDYSKPLDVRWLCAAHHREHHNQAAPRET